MGAQRVGIGWPAVFRKPKHGQVKGVRSYWVRHASTAACRPVRVQARTQLSGTPAGASSCVGDPRTTKYTRHGIGGGRLRHAMWRAGGGCAHTLEYLGIEGQDRRARFALHAQLFAPKPPARQADWKPEPCRARTGSQVKRYTAAGHVARPRRRKRMHPCHRGALRQPLAAAAGPPQWRLLKHWAILLPANVAGSLAPAPCGAAGSLTTKPTASCWACRR